LLNKKVNEFKDKGLQKGNELPAMASPNQVALAKPQTKPQQVLHEPVNKSSTL